MLFVRILLPHNGINETLSRSDADLVAAQSKASVCGRAIAGIKVSNPPVSWMCVCCAICVLSDRGLYAGLSLVQRSPCGVSECDREVPTT